ncbi:hypothetical protein [Mobilicoccus pelagius]|uniref:Transglycosylase SLT domain-containing protein n=1 Tax=Mobilicoccus pelagius NBRC 104925 TaxID=1089455 RepID=H5UW20_9MICO|nr:hypothetical protein [Mobilicoccus pelagius]GAB49928.1 hypothetical protein MOPEL_135_01660 [Mobilicoccus pelagius NBRC 104925]
MRRRRLDAEGYDLPDDTDAFDEFDDVEETHGRVRRPAVLVGAGSALVVTLAAGLVAWTLTRPTDSEAVTRAADAEIVTSLGNRVVGGGDAVEKSLPLATSALDGTIGAPPGLAAGERDVVPPRVLEAYRSAESRLADDAPRCRLPWWLLAGVGKVQSDHAASGQVDAAGVTTVRVVGPRLDGSIVGSTTVRDTDQGALDGDLTFDRGVGPMLVVPSTWAAIGRDGDGDGNANVADVDDAALSVGTLLCSAGADVTTPEGLARALVRVDDGATFPGDVLPWAAHYRATGVTAGVGQAAVPGPSTRPSGAPGSGSPTRRGGSSPTHVPTNGPGFTTQPTDAPPSRTPPPAVRPVPGAGRPTPRPTTAKPAPGRPVAPPPVAPQAPRPPKALNTSEKPVAPRPPVAPPPPVPQDPPPPQGDTPKVDPPTQHVDPAPPPVDTTQREDPPVTEQRLEEPGGDAAPPERHEAAEEAADRARGPGRSEERRQDRGQGAHGRGQEKNGRDGREKKRDGEKASGENTPG